MATRAESAPRSAARSASSWLPALLGVLLATPFLVLNALVANGVDAVRWFFRGVVSRDVLQTNPLGLWVFVLTIGLIAVGALVAGRGGVVMSATGRRSIQPLNLVMGIVLLGLFVLLVTVLGAEVYECEVLGVPNCD